MVALTPNTPTTLESSRGADESGLTAAAYVVAQALQAGRTNISPKYDSWQRELWDYYDTLGEFNIAVTWRSYMMSRVRLRAAKLNPGSDEPEILDSGPAADLMNELFGGTSGQSQMMSSLSVFLDVPAECWLTGEKIGGRNVWNVRSSDEVRRQGRGYEVITDNSYEGAVEWRALGTDSYVTRIWRPHKRLRYLPYSPALPARGAMRELELVNRHIQAQYLSRLASAGLVVFPDELVFPVRPEFMDAPDPFVREWIETAAEAIRTPGSASAIIPLPIRVPAEYVEKIKHIDFTLKIDDNIIEKRNSARDRLGNMINVPSDLLFNAGEANHWSLWQLEEGAIRTYITPDAELIADSFTIGYLHPRLKAQGDDTTDIIVWYDASELMVRPDKSTAVKDVYDRGEASGKALRRESGLDEDDAPTDEEINDMVLKKLAVNPTVGFTALEALTGLKVEQPAPEPAPIDTTEPTDEPPEDDDAPDNGPPDTADDAPPEPTAPPQAPAASTQAGSRDYAFTILQAKSTHVIEFTVAGWRLKHPLLCQPKLFSCPFTHATFEGVSVHPGTNGSYECWLDTKGEFIIGSRVFPHDEQLIADAERRVNGARNGSHS
jgi:hypothetical protein